MTVTTTSDPFSGKHVIEVVASSFGGTDAQAVEDAVVVLAASGPKPCIVVDLIGVRVIDDDGLAVLLACYRRVKALHGTFCLVCCEAGSLGSLRRSGIDKSIVVHAARESALIG